MVGGRWVADVGAVVVLADTLDIDLGHLAKAFRVTIQSAREHRGRIRAVELARREAERR
jgi:hypothetical protein